MEKHPPLARGPAIGAHMAQYLEEAALKEQDDQDPASNNKKQAIEEVPLARIKRIMKSWIHANHLHAWSVLRPF